MHEKIPVIIVDAVALFREGIRLTLCEAAFLPVWCGDRPPSAFLKILPDQATPLLIIGTEVHQAIHQIAEVKHDYPSTRAVMLVDKISKLQILEAIRCGADALVPKSSSPETLVATLKLVLDGASVLPTKLLDELLAQRNAQNGAGHVGCLTFADSQNARLRDVFGLSEREIHVLILMIDGLPNKHIAHLIHGIIRKPERSHIIMSDAMPPPFCWLDRVSDRIWQA
jgi:DNA-binding NarL/FixJ family response regulator